MGSARSVRITLGLPQLTVLVLSWSTLLRLHVALQGNCPKWALGFAHFPGLSCSGSGSQVLHEATDWVGHAFCALPRSKELRRPGAWWAHCPRWSGVLITSPVPATQFPGCAARAPSQVCPVSPLGSWSLAATLLADINRPGSQEDLVSNWEPAHNLVEDAISGAKIAPCLPALAVTSLPLCLWWENRPVRRQLASSILCSVRVLLWESSLSLSFFFSLRLSYNLGCYLTLNPSDSPQGIQAQSLPQACNPCLPVQPQLAGGRRECLGYFFTGSCSLACILCVCVFSPSLLCCPLRFQNSPQTRQWEGFLVFGNFPSFTTPLWDGSLSLTLLSLFLSFIFCPTYFQKNVLPFWVSGVLCQCSEVIWWKLLSIQMIFWWICEAESGLPILFLHHHRTTPFSWQSWFQFVLHLAQGFSWCTLNIS